MRAWRRTWISSRESAIPAESHSTPPNFLADHQEYSWQAPVLRDMDAGPWTEFRRRRARRHSSSDPP